MIYQVIGISEVHYKNKQGNEVNGTRLYLVYDSNSPSLQGQGCEAVFVGNRVELPSLMVGDLINLLYNRFGSVESVVKV